MKLLARRSNSNALGKLYGNSMSGFPHRLLGLLLLTGSMASCGLGEDFGEVVLKLQEPSYAAEAVQSAGRANSSHMVRMQKASPEPPPVPSSTTRPAAIPTGERLVIKTAGLDLAINAYEPWMNQVRGLAQGHGGFIVNASTQQARQNVKKGNLTLRVPQASFIEVLETLKNSAIKVEGERQGGEDVTEEFYDVKARLDNQRRTEKRFQEILVRAKSVEEILSVERELSRVRETIERLEGRQRFLRDRVDLSTISVNWHEPYPLGSDRSGTGFWSIIGKGFRRGIERFAYVLRDLIAFSIYSLPVLGFATVVIWVVVWLVRWRRRRSFL